MPTEKFMNLGDYKKQAILDAMRAEFMTTPYSEIRISSLIKRAGISRASFYLYFQSKEDLFTCMMHQLRERLVQGLVEAFQEQKSSFDASMSRLVNRIMDDERLLGVLQAGDGGWDLQRGGSLRRAGI